MNHYYNTSKCIIVDNTVVDWTAKAGCTAVISMLFKKLGVLERAQKYHETGWIHYYREEVINKTNKSTFTQMLTDPNLYKIKFVRCPYRRAVSSYIHACKHPKLRAKLPGDGDISFIYFLNLLHTKALSYDPHWCLQTKQLELNNNIFDKIIPLEDLPKQLDTIRNHIDLEPVLYNKHHVKYDDNIHNYVGRVKWSNINHIPAPRYFYCNESKELVDYIYKHDITNYNYKYPYS